MPHPQPRLALLLLAAALPACGPEQVVGLAAGGAASLALTGKTPVDHAASWWTGRDCSAVRLELREPWCAPPATPPPPPAFCTRSIGAVDCWTTPPPGAGRGVADPPRQVRPDAGRPGGDAPAGDAAGGAGRAP